MGRRARVTLGDAFLTPVREARTAALAAKQVIREGRDPFKEQQAARAATESQRALAPTITRDAFALYEKAIKARSEPKLKSRLQHLRYVPRRSIFSTFAIVRCKRSSPARSASCSDSAGLGFGAVAHLYRVRENS